VRVLADIQGGIQREGGRATRQQCASQQHAGRYGGQYSCAPVSHGGYYLRRSDGQIRKAMPY